MKERNNFFDSHAETWDSGIRKRDLDNIETIMQYAKISSKDTILDVGTGTGILIPFFKKKGVIEITAIDFSKKMVEIFKTKFPEVKIHNTDYEKRYFDDESFSKIFIFNTFPHFNNYKNVFQLSYDYLVPGGALIIAHSMSREELNQIHRDAGKEVEKDILISDDEFRNLYSENGFVDINVISNNSFFASGIKSCKIKGV